MRTSLYSILCIAIRLGAVFMAVQVLVGVPTALGELLAAQVTVSTKAAIAFGVAELAAAGLLWLYPGILARIAAATSSQQVFESPITATELQQLAFAVLGICFVVQGLVDLVDIGTSLSMGVLTGDALDRYMRQYGWPWIGREAIRIAFGIGLALGARGLATALFRWREYGLVAPQRDETPGG